MSNVGGVICCVHICMCVWLPLTDTEEETLKFQVLFHCEIAAG